MSYSDGTTRKVSSDHIGNFEVVEKTSEACEFVEKRGRD